MDTYINFLRTKIEIAPETGFAVSPEEVNPVLKLHQKDGGIWAVKGGCRALFESFGMGKCHGKGTKILMHDCSIKNVEDVVIGDLLMGDDGTPRKVLSLARGKEPIYRVTLKNGDSFTCNESHILACTMSNKFRGLKMGDKTTLSLKEFLTLPKYAQKNCFKQYKVPLDFDNSPVPMNPYIYGAWIGDGSKNKLSFTINDVDTEIVEYIKKWSQDNGFEIRAEGGRGCKTYHVHNGTKHNQKYKEKELLKSSSVNGKKINRKYLVNSKEVRLALLAGIIDTDGYLIDKCYEVTTKYKCLCNDILFLCRSLGLSVAHNEKLVKGVVYYRIYISGDTHIIPCKTRKKAGIRKQIKNPLVYGLDVELLGKDDYYGFEIDGNHLYLLGDFTVTHNTIQELEYCRLVTEHEGGKALIILPLGVKQEFTHDAVGLLGWAEAPQYVRNMDEVRKAAGQILLTNYERVRDGDIDPDYFTAISLDEASVLRSDSSKTHHEFIRKFKNVKYKLVCTATPSPNDYIELIFYAAFLGIMDKGQAKTRFFKRDSTKADKLTLFPHKEKEFWLWVSTWALFITKPSDLGYSDQGYDLPPLDVRYHEIPVDHKAAGTEKNGQLKLVRDAATGLIDAAREKRDSIKARVAKMAEIVRESPDDHFILWHDLEAERHAIKAAIPGVVDIYGSQDLDIREQRVVDFANGKIKLFATKKELSGSGCNFQRHCHRAIFVGIDYKFNDFIQAIHRIYRFLQTDQVIIDIIYTESERQVLQALLAKWEQHNQLVEKMTAIIRENGLASTNIEEKMRRTIGVERVEIKGQNFVAVNNDCVLEMASMLDNSIDLFHTSLPFSIQYEYTPSYNDFGHNADNEQFFKQMDFLIPEIHRTLKPGRVAAIHVKDRIVFGNFTGHGMPSLYPFSDETRAAFCKHGFIFFGRITVVTDVVRENNQTYRLGWTECCKDGTKMGVGVPEYVLLFRKLPTDTGKAYADTPVTRLKEDYWRAQWQLDAHGYWRSSGERFLTVEEMRHMDKSSIIKAWKEYNRKDLYSYPEHVQIAKNLEDAGNGSTSFMMVPPESLHPDVWTDITRIRTLNTMQSQKRLSNHICPLQFDIVERIINRYSNRGETVADPFAGLMTVPYMAVKMGRKGWGCELNPEYFKDGIGYLNAIESTMDVPSLFDFLAEEIG